MFWTRLRSRACMNDVSQGCIRIHLTQFWFQVPQFRASSESGLLTVQHLVQMRFALFCSKPQLKWAIFRSLFHTLARPVIKLIVRYHSCVEVCTNKNVALSNFYETFSFVNYTGIGSKFESSGRPFWGNSYSGTSHSGPIPSPNQNGLQSEIESESGLGRLPS